MSPDDTMSTTSCKSLYLRGAASVPVQSACVHHAQLSALAVPPEESMAFTRACGVSARTENTC